MGSWGQFMCCELNVLMEFNGVIELKELNLYCWPIVVAMLFIAPAEVQYSRGK